MARVRAVDAAVRVLEKEGVTCAVGVPGAAINPPSSALKARGRIRRILARHVEGASHMAEGYTRAAPSNVGLCLGTSGTAGTDMVTGIHSTANLQPARTGQRAVSGHDRASRRSDLLRDLARRWNHEGRRQPDDDRDRRDWRTAQRIPAMKALRTVDGVNR
ncbi:hypothetical protein DB459_16570 [Bradyrhizobium sp. WD16]|nr:hypothetical protein DB459_16570 [Bradyrhizobium sp. WD16]